MHPALAAIVTSTPVITDGAWGTELQALGLAPGEVPDFWNHLHPDRVRRVADNYVSAGSRVILTNTFRANRIALGTAAARDQVVRINTEGVALSRQAAGTSAVVFASVGPSGKLLMDGQVTEEELHAAFSEQAFALAGAGAAALLLETFTDLDEALIALHASRKTGLPVIVSMVFDSGKAKDRTMMGLTPEKTTTALEEAGADGIGANCGLGIEQYVPICERLRAATSLPLWIKPNAGLPTMVDGTIHYPITPAAFAETARLLRSVGAQFIGGCCGTSPAFIRALVTSLG